MALSIPFSGSSHASFLCLLMFVLMYLKGAPVYGAKKEHDKPYHVVNVKSLDPNPYCIESTKDQRKRESLKVVQRHGPCSRMNEARTSAPTLVEIMSHDQARVDSLQHRLHVNSDRNNLNDSKATLPAKPGRSIGSANYVVTLGLGTPKKDLTLIFDTGSDVTWIQCQPCMSCYEQQEPIFNPSDSQTYKNVSCTSPQCSPDLQLGCTRSTNTCVYAVVYGDGSFTLGLYATETLTLTPSDIFPGFAFGCGLNNTGLFSGAAGLLGLGRGPASLVAQTASKYGSYFSYCLPTSSSSSGTLVFGKDGGSGTTNSAGIKYTTLSANSNGPSFYFIEVTGIKVSGELLPIDQSVFSSAGTIIDSGTVITRLQSAAYDALRMRFRQLMMNYTMTQGVSLFDTCYDFSGHDTVVVPKISFLFAGDIEVPIELVGILYKVGPSRFCLAFAGNSDASDAGIFGNVQQQTLDVVYDVAGGKLGFGSGGCS
ncbi:aspartyl protease family protein At5g10770-like isoform X2 [Rhododendron vialii]|uniref:aspartyl protease family protein At5g10770-like isoform X2 n=1 Tax=Rhododendron vialii TaxID=182163 RepID=UPI00265DAE56|nr:aspartyl protease family protein At5g10770-like isoform X2 [Rhododendron vialii]